MSCSFYCVKKSPLLYVMEIFYFSFVGMGIAIFKMFLQLQMIAGLMRYNVALEKHYYSKPTASF
jgi:hypothetical protein